MTRPDFNDIPPIVHIQDDSTYSVIDDPRVDRFLRAAGILGVLYVLIHVVVAVVR